ncbi:MAG: Archease protein family [archaeon]|jgi:SHS2 domain-containing protein
MKYKLLDATTFEAYGTSLEECFAHAALALLHVICKEKITSNEKKKIIISGKDRKQLLHSFLEKMLYLLEVGGFLTSEVNQLRISGMPVVKGTRKFYNLTLHAEVYGDEAKNYAVDHPVTSIRSHTISETLTEDGKKFTARIELT